LSQGRIPEKDEEEEELDFLTGESLFSARELLTGEFEDMTLLSLGHNPAM
jgi:hypothetical protein